MATRTLPHLGWRQASAVIGILAVVVAVGVIAAVVLASNDGTPAASADLTARTRIVVANPVAGTLLSQLSLVNADTGKQSAIGQPDSYSQVRWSPDGSTIAALATPTDAGQTSRLQLISMPAGRSTTRELGASSIFVAWSPTSEHAAVVGQHVYLLGLDGAVLADAAAPVTGDANSNEVVGAGYSWSPDGGLFAAGVNGLMIAMTPGGSVLTKPLTSLTGSASDLVAIGGWLDNTTVAVSTPEANYAVDASGTDLTARKMADNEDIPTAPGNREPDPAAVAAAEDLIPGGKVMQSRTSADGAADVLEVRAGAGGSEVHLVIRDRNTGDIFEAKDLPIDLRGAGLYDVYVAPR